MNWEKCEPGNIWCFLGSTETMAALSWLGMIVTLFGFGIAIYQSVKAKNAAEAARAAASKLQIHIDGVNLAYLSAQMSNVIHLVRLGDFALAQAIFVPIKRSARLHHASLDPSETEVEELRRVMGKIDNQLYFGASKSEKFKAHLVAKHLDEFLEVVTGWESSIAATEKMESPIEDN